MVWNDETGSLSPLPTKERALMKAMAVCGLLSTASTSLLWLHMTFRLLRWKLEDWKKWRKRTCPSQRGEEVDLSLGLPETAYRQAKRLPPPPSPEQGPRHSHTASLATNGGRSLNATLSNGPSPILILIYNLILADVFLSAAYLENVVWLQKDAIIVGSSYCHAQGWLISLGCLASTLFLGSMALHTYLAMMHGYQPENYHVMLNIVVVWAAALVLASLAPFTGMGIGMDFFGRNNLWCWINHHNYAWRLTVYIPGHGCIAVAWCLYTVIFWRLYKEKRRSASFISALLRQTKTDRMLPLGQHPAFLIYPYVFLLSAGPVTIGSMFHAGENNTTYMGVTGCLMALTGFLDTILWGTTILFSDAQSIDQTGLSRFAITTESQRRAFGNMVWVQGGGGAREQGGGGQRQKPAGKGWWVLGGSEAEPDSRGNHSRMVDEGVRVDTETSVVVERDGWKDRPGRVLKMPRLESLELHDLSGKKTAVSKDIYIGVHRY